MRQRIELQRVQHVLDRRHAVDQPRVLVAAHDLLFIRGAHQATHHRAHHVIERDHPHHQAVFVHDHGEILVHQPELLQHLGQREPVGHDQHLAQQGVVGQRERLVVQHALEQVLGIHIAHHVVDIAVAHRVGGKRLGGDARADHRVRIVTQKVGDAVALRHGRGHRARIQLEHVGDHLLLARGQHASTGACLHQGQDVVGRDAVVAHRGQAQQGRQAVGQPVEQPHQRLEQRREPLHGAAHQYRQPLRFGHREALGQQVGQQDEQRGDEDEGGEKAHRGRCLGRQPGREPAGEIRRERAFAHHAAQNGHGVHPNLHHGEILARLLLRAYHQPGARIALVHHLAQPQLA